MQETMNCFVVHYSRTLIWIVHCARPSEILLKMSGRIESLLARSTDRVPSPNETRFEDQRQTKVTKSELCDKSDEIFTLIRETSIYRNYPLRLNFKLDHAFKARYIQ